MAPVCIERNSLHTDTMSQGKTDETTEALEPIRFLWGYILIALT